MAEPYYRAQLLLEPEQHQRLRRIAKREGRSISDVAREVVGIGLETLAADDEARARRRALALGHLDQIREAVRSRHGVFEGDLLGEARREREATMDRARKAGS